jgi:hypothetical protein
MQAQDLLRLKLGPDGRMGPEPTPEIPSPSGAILEKGRRVVGRLSYGRPVMTHNGRPGA